MGRGAQIYIGDVVEERETSRHTVTPHVEESRPSDLHRREIAASSCKQGEMIFYSAHGPDYFKAQLEFVTKALNRALQTVR